ncbi:MAG: TlpA family protein disulfide reductase [Nitrospiraceae bacterium]|nr:MAG: TlpA family protein disulfide reductase [Nitrospiraceae bacterium]
MNFNMKRPSLTYAFYFIAAILVFCSQINVSNAQGFDPLLYDSSVGSKAPDFTLKDVSGKEVSLSSFKGKPVLLNFWATWCPYCRKERPHLNALHKDYKDKGLIILSVSTDQSTAKLKDFMKNTPADFIVLSDSNGTAASLYNVGGLPTSYIVNREGIIKQRFVGFREWSDNGSKTLIDKLLDD